MTYPNYFLTYPKKVGISQILNRLIPINLGEVCCKIFLSPFCRRKEHDFSQLLLTYPNYSLTYPKKVGISQKTNRLIPINLGEVCWKQFYSTFCQWNVNDFSQLFLTYPNFCLTYPNNVGISKITNRLIPINLGEVCLNKCLCPDISEKSWDKSNSIRTYPRKVGISMYKWHDFSQKKLLLPKNLGEVKYRQKWLKKLGDVCGTGTLCPLVKSKTQGDLGLTGWSWEMSEKLGYVKTVWEKHGNL